MKVGTLVVLAMAVGAPALGATPGDRNPLIAGIVSEVSQSRIEANIRKLATFGTRNSLSDAVSETRGVGAARRWIKTELERCSQAAGGRLEVAFDEHLIETGAREGELGRQPRRTRAIFMKYSDRIMFGTDEGASEAMYENYFRWLETDDEYFPYAQYPAQGRWMIYGLGLPDDLLEKVYHRNAEALFARFKDRNPSSK